MKYLKITLLEQGTGPIVYPDSYQSQIGDFAVDHLYYDSVKGDGESELLLCIMDDKYNANMIRDRVALITETEAKAISEQYETRTEVILDEAKVKRLEIKAQVGMTLSTEELDALDPAKPDSAFGVSKILADRVVDLKADEAVIKAK